MKKLLLLVLLIVSTSAIANDRRHYGNSGHWQHSRNNNWVWIVPAIIGGAIVYEASRQPPPQPVIVYEASRQPLPQPVIIQQPTEPNCSPWTEIQNPDGSITRTRTCRN